MSDANTDIARDEERNKRIMAYIEVLRDYLASPAPEKRSAVIETARHLDDYKYHGYWTGPTTESSGIEERLDKLVEGDAEAWANFLKRFNEGPILEEFKALSPIHNRHKNN